MKETSEFASEVMMNAGWRAQAQQASAARTPALSAVKQALFFASPRNRTPIFPPHLLFGLRSRPDRPSIVPAQPIVGQRRSKQRPSLVSDTVGPSLRRVRLRIVKAGACANGHPSPPRWPLTSTAFILTNHTKDGAEVGRWSAFAFSAGHHKRVCAMWLSPLKLAILAGGRPRLALMQVPLQHGKRHSQRNNGVG